MYTLSLDIGATKTVFAAIGEHGQITRQQKISTLDLLTRSKTPATSLAAALHSFCNEQTIALASVVFVGSGIGCGLILNGELYVGSDGAAAELSHTIIDPAGLSWPSQETLNAPWQLAEALVSVARVGHPAAQEAMQQLCTYLGVSLVTLANLLNPRLILLGGGIVTGWPESIEIARTIAQTRSRIVVRDRLQVERTVLDEQAGLLGAAALVMNKMR